MSLPITVVSKVTVLQSPIGVAEYQINNLAILTSEVPSNPDWNTDNPNGYGVYEDSASVAADFGFLSEAYQQALEVFAQTPNITSGGGVLIVRPIVRNSSSASVSLSEAMAELSALVFVGGFNWCNFIPEEQEILDAATVCQSVDGSGVRRLLFIPSASASDYASQGLFDTVRASSLTCGRCLFYSVSALEARLFSAGYASLGMSTNFDGSGLSQTLQGKQLAGIAPDPAVNMSVYSQLQAVGADCYPKVGGRTQLMTSGANDFFDNVYQLNWFAGACTVAYFNALVTTSTKVEQTESGMVGLRQAVEEVCRQGVNVGFISDGGVPWTSADKFGDPMTFLSNILGCGFYVWTPPISSQSQASREARIAPPMRVAIKARGAIHSGDIFVNFNR